MQSGATTIPCPHCGAKLPVGARFCADCGKAIVPARRASLPDDVTEVEVAAPAAPSPPGKKRQPLPDDVTEVEVAAPPSQSPGTRRPRPDDITLVDPPVSAVLAPQGVPRPDDITVVEPPVQAGPAQTPRMPGPDDITVVEPPATPPAVAPGMGAGPGAPTWGTMPGQLASAAGWPSPAGNPSLSPPQPAAPAAGNAPFSGPQPGAGPYNRSPAVGGSPTGWLPPPQFPVISGKFPLKKRTIFSSKGGWIALAMLLLLIIAGIVSVFFIVQSINRHGLPNDIPLPTAAKYVKTIEQLPPHQADEAWLYTIASMSPAQVIDFYEARLPGNGWEKVMRTIDGGAPVAQGSGEIVACKMNKAVQIEADQTSLEGVGAPPGGVTLEIVLGPASEVQNCA
jgi:hypothetical protein